MDIMKKVYRKIFNIEKRPQGDKDVEKEAKAFYRNLFNVPNLNYPKYVRDDQGKSG